MNPKYVAPLLAMWALLFAGLSLPFVCNDEWGRITASTADYAERPSLTGFRQMEYQVSVELSGGMIVVPLTKAQYAKVDLYHDAKVRRILWHYGVVELR